MSNRDETYLYAGYLFDVEMAKRMAADQRSFPIIPHRTFPGMCAPTPKKADLKKPAIFATFWLESVGDWGVLLIDGSHRVKYALKHKKKIRAVFLTPGQSWEVLGRWQPKWRNHHVKKLHLSKRFVGKQLRLP